MATSVTQIYRIIDGPFKGNEGPIWGKLMGLIMIDGDGELYGVTREQVELLCTVEVEL